MFFNKLHHRLMRNQRFRSRVGEHQLSLDIPPSRKEAAMLRRRITLVVIKWGVGLGLGLWAFMACGQLWDESFQKSTSYAVGQFELATNGSITSSDVSEVTGLRPDQNITTLDLPMLRQKLLTLPKVKGAALERRLPNHLLIRLEERRPAAWLASGRQKLRPFDSRGLLLDAEGIVFPAGLMLNDYMALPVIHWEDLASVTPGRKTEFLILQALELVRLMTRQSWNQFTGAQHIHIINGFTLIAQLNNDALVTFHPDGLEKQLARLDAILHKVGPTNRKVASVNLQLERNVPVTFFDVPEPRTAKPPARSKPASPGARRPATPATRRST